MTTAMAMSPLIVAVGALGLVLVPVAVGHALHHTVAPPLGGWMLRATGAVQIRHSYLDPVGVRRRLRRAAIVMALPGLLGGPAVALVAPWWVGDAGGWRVAVAVVLAAVGTPAAAALARTGWLVGTIRPVGPARARATLVACVVAAPLAIATALAFEFDGGWLLATATAMVTVWMLGAVALANDLRIVAAWDRVCAYRHRHGKEARDGRH